MTDIETRSEQTLPNGWVWARFKDLVLDPKSDIVDGPFGSNLKASEYVDSGVPIIRLQNIDRNRFIRKNIRFITPEKAEQLQRHSFTSKDIVITKLGTPLGEACLVPDYLPRGIVVADVVRARIGHPHAMKEYLIYAINSDVAIRQLEAKTKGTTRPRVNLGHIRNLLIPFAPLPEQRRIVAEIETQFTRLDAAVAALERAQANIRRYKAAMLQAACEGQLVPTEAELARAEGRLYEPADQLLARILAERRARWEAAHPGKRYKEPAPPDMENLPELPEGWVWANVGQMADVGTGATPLRSNRAYYEDGTIPWVKSSALNDLFVDSTEEFITELALAETNVKVFPAGTLLVAMYGEGKTRGKVSELKIDGATNQACAALLFDDLSSGCKPYTKVFFQKNYDDIRRLSSGGVQPNLNLSIIRGTAVPLPPLTEQRRIVAEVDRRLSLVAALEASMEAALVRAGRLRQAVLKQAFEGRLVHQDPDDEPASVLLERIQAKRDRKPQKRNRKNKQPVQLKLL